MPFSQWEGVTLRALGTTRPRSSFTEMSLLAAKGTPQDVGNPNRINEALNQEQTTQTAS